jgi:hypothetical protein
MAGHCKGVYTSGTRGWALVRASPRESQWGERAQKPLSCTRFHEMLRGDQHAI